MKQFYIKTPGFKVLTFQFAELTEVMRKIVDTNLINLLDKIKLPGKINIIIAIDQIPAGCKYIEILILLARNKKQSKTGGYAKYSPLFFWLT